eukprot:COSAG04_NODE_29196_length_270_cov_1.087719_1_plen_89_part_11
MVDRDSVAVSFDRQPAAGSLGIDGPARESVVDKFDMDAPGSPGAGAGAGAGGGGGGAGVRKFRVAADSVLATVRMSFGTKTIGFWSSCT